MSSLDAVAPPGAAASGAGGDYLDDASHASSTGASPRQTSSPGLPPPLTAAERARLLHPTTGSLNDSFRECQAMLRDYPSVLAQPLSPESQAVADLQAAAASDERERLSLIRQRTADFLSHAQAQYFSCYSLEAQEMLRRIVTFLLDSLNSAIPASSSDAMLDSFQPLVSPCLAFYALAAQTVGASPISDVSTARGAHGVIFARAYLQYVRAASLEDYLSTFLPALGLGLELSREISRRQTSSSSSPSRHAADPASSSSSPGPAPTTWASVAQRPAAPRPAPSAATSSVARPRVTQVEIFNLNVAPWNYDENMIRKALRSRSTTTTLLSSLGFSEPRHQTWVRARYHSRSNKTKTGIMLFFPSRQAALAALTGKGAILADTDVTANLWENLTCPSSTPPLTSAEREHQAMALRAQLAAASRPPSSGADAGDAGVGSSSLPQAQAGEASASSASATGAFASSGAAAGVAGAGSSSLPSAQAGGASASSASAPGASASSGAASGDAAPMVVDGLVVCRASETPFSRFFVDDGGDAHAFLGVSGALASPYFVRTSAGDIVATRPMLATTEPGHFVVLPPPPPDESDWSGSNTSMEVSSPSKQSRPHQPSGVSPDRSKRLRNGAEQS